MSTKENQRDKQEHEGGYGGADPEATDETPPQVRPEPPQQPGQPGQDPQPPQPQQSAS